MIMKNGNKVFYKGQLIGEVYQIGPGKDNWGYEVYDSHRPQPPSKRLIDIEASRFARSGEGCHSRADAAVWVRKAYRALPELPKPISAPDIPKELLSGFVLLAEEDYNLLMEIALRNRDWR